MKSLQSAGSFIIGLNSSRSFMKRDYTARDTARVKEAGGRKSALTREALVKGL